MSSVFSRRFIAVQGLTGASSVVVVPAGHTYVIKQLTAFGDTAVGGWSADFRCTTSGETRFSAGSNLGAKAWFGLYGALVFEEGDGFQWQAFVQPLDSIDVYAGGYDLTN